MVVRIRPGSAEEVCISVEDNGAGIAPEHLPKLFTQGFTTKEKGHGFGLHTSALAAKQMRGALEGASAGLGCGAMFVLKLPNQPPKREVHDSLT